MKKKELIRKGLVVLISSAILMTGCASKENSTAPVTSQTENESAQTENNSQDIADKTPKDDSQKTDSESLKDDSQKTDSESSKDDTQETDAKKPENNSNTEDKEDSQESKSDVSDSSKIENEENEEAGGNKETEEENEEVTFTDINSGSIYETIQSIDPELQIQDANSGEYLAITMDKPDVDVDSKETIKRFFWDAVQFLKTEVFKDTYDSVQFIFLGKDSFEIFNMSKFESFDNFMTSYIGPLSKNDTNYFSAYYKTIFATRDTSGSTSKLEYELSKEYGIDYELPDSYQEAYLWIFANFNHDCGFSIKENTVTVEIPTENTVESGANIYPQIKSAIKALNEILVNRPEAFPYEKFSIKCIDSLTGTTLLTRIFEKSTNSWENTKNTGTGDFLTGYNSNFSSDSDTLK